MVQYDIKYSITMTAAEHKSSFELTRQAMWALTGKLCGACCEEFWVNWLYYDGTVLYKIKSLSHNEWTGL